MICANFNLDHATQEFYMSAARDACLLAPNACLAIRLLDQLGPLGLWV